MNKLVVLLVTLCSLPALAQPMMIDPSRMSGLSRPDPQVPAGGLTVRLIRGDFAHSVGHVTVELTDGSGKLFKSEKTDEDGRATFSGLGSGPYVARATDHGQTLTTQPIQLQSDMGSRTMLVFPKITGPGEPDGLARPDPKLPKHSATVRAVDGDNLPLAGLEVVLGRARVGQRQVTELKGKTDAKGEAHFDDLPAESTDGYLAEVVKDGVRYAGKPFRLDSEHGMLVAIRVQPVSRDTSALTIGPGSHIIIEIGDDAVQVAEVWRLSNSAAVPVDLGPAGLRLPLPDKALQVTAGPQSPPNFSVQGHSAVWKGPIPPGDTELQVMFLLAYKSDTVELRQRTPLAFADVAVVTDKLKKDLSISGPGMQTEERELGGHKFLLARGPGTKPGGEIDVTISGLPRSSALVRNLAAGVAVAILIAFGLFAFGGPKASGVRQQLVEERESLLAELARLDQTPGQRPTDAKRRDQLVDKLAKIYREIDELGT